GLGELAVLAKADRLVVRLPRSEVLVLRDPRPGNRLLAIIDHRIALVVSVRIEALEHEAAVLQASELVIEIRIERTAPEQVLELPRIAPLQPPVQMHVDRRMVQQLL